MRIGTEMETFEAQYWGKQKYTDTKRRKRHFTKEEEENDNKIVYKTENDNY